jgi:hypothetical protein
MNGGGQARAPRCPGSRSALRGPVVPRRTPRHQPFGSPALHQLAASATRSTPKAPVPMPLPRRGGEPRLAGARVVRTSLPRATPRSPKRVGRGAPLLSHAQRLTRRRHSSEQVPPEPEQADFRSGKWLQERAGGDARDPRHTPLARMGSRQRSVAAVPLGRAVPGSRSVGQLSRGVRTSLTGPACQAVLSPAPGPTWNRPPLNRPAHAATGTRLGRALGRA